MHKNYSNHSNLRIAISLSLITLLGPAAVDMYLPSMLKMAADLNTTYETVTYSLTVFLIALGIGQLVFGPITDAQGRRKPLLLGITLYIITSFLAATANSIEFLLVVRFVQGIAASLALVVAISMVRDISSGVASAQIFALLMTIEGLAPVVAPTLGGFIGQKFSWHAVMIVLAILGIVALLNSFISLPESLDKEKRLPMNPSGIAKTYWSIASDMKFLMPTLALSSVFFFLFMFISGAPNIYQNYFNLSESLFGLVFGVTGISVLIGATLSGYLTPRFGIVKLSVVGGIIIIIGAVVAYFASVAGLGLHGVSFGIFIALFGVGIAEAAAMSIAMGSQDKALGSTAALLGCLQMVISACATPISGGIAGLGPNIWLSSLIACSVIVFILIAISARLHK